MAYKLLYLRKLEPVHHRRVCPFACSTEDHVQRNLYKGAWCKIGLETPLIIYFSLFLMVSDLTVHAQLEISP